MKTSVQLWLYSKAHVMVVKLQSDKWKRSYQQVFQMRPINSKPVISKLNDFTVRQEQIHQVITMLLRNSFLLQAGAHFTLLKVRKKKRY